MTGGGGGGGGEGGRRAPPQQQPQPPTTGGEFLLQLLQKPHQPQPQNPFVNSSPSSSTPLPSSHTVHPPPPHLDPAAVASLGPNFPFPSNGHDHPQHHPLPPWMLNPTNFPPTPNNTPWGLTGLPPPPNLHHLPIFADELQRLGLLGGDGRVVHQHQQQQQKEQGIMMFGSVPTNFRNNEGGLNGNFMDQRSLDVDRRNAETQFGVHSAHVDRRNAETQFGVHSAHVDRRNLEAQFGFHKSREVVGASPCPDIWSNPNQWDNSSQGSVGGRARQQQHVPLRSSPVGEPRSTPPGFPQKLKALNQWGSVSQRQELEGNVVKEDNSQDRLNSQAHHSYNNDKVIRSNSQGNASSRLRLSGQLDHPGPPVGSKLMSVPALDIEESLAILRGQFVEEDGGYNSGRHENRVRDDTSGPAHRMSGRHGQEDLSEELMNAVRISNGLEKNIIRHNINSRDKDLIFDISKELQPPGQRMRNNNRRVVECRSDIDKMDAPFLKIYESLVPAEEEKAKQKQLLTSLEKLVNKEWPSAQLYLYGSCANSFGVSNSDIDVCLAIEDENINKSELLLKLADILQEDNLQNVQALTRARVPIVKLLDPVTGISCDICVNNVLAVVNTKLLRDYAQIDGRLRQLAFIVKYWAKSRGVNVTYQGTLSSYAYVLMCIHFLQQRKPSILPCLQAMEATYVVSIDDIECAYFDQVQNLRDFGARNKETIAQLVWAFFDYWAYRHDYANAVISVRTGSIISKRAKDWTRRIGNDRHLICIEDPFETSHDLGRVVDKYSIKILREEFERAANIMQYDPDPCVTLFERYVPS